MSDRRRNEKKKIPALMWETTIGLSTHPGDSPGWPVLGEQFERCWMPSLGPTPVALARLVVRGQGEFWTVVEIADALGVGKGPVRSTIERLMYYGLAVFDVESMTLSVGENAPMLNASEIPSRVVESGAFG